MTGPTKAPAPTPHPIRERATERFPSVLLTLLSIVQALALEVLWSSIQESSHLFERGFGLLIGWLQVSAVLLGIIVVWLFYSSLMLRLSWLPSTRDSVLPFVIGMLEFSLAELLSPEYLALWFYLLASMFALCSVTSMMTFKKARLDPQNAGFFENFMPYSRASLAAPLGFFVLLLGFGGVVQLFGPRGFVALAAIAAANAFLVLQLLVIRYFWNRSLGLSESSHGAEAQGADAHDTPGARGRDARARDTRTPHTPGRDGGEAETQPSLPRS